MRTPGIVVALVGTAIATVACGGDTDYLGQPPVEASMALAQQACDQIFECGALSLECDPPSGMYMDPSVFFATEDECRDDLGAFYGALLAGCTALGLTAAQADDLNACLNYQQGCLSEAELMELAVAACAAQPAGSEACFRSQPTYEACMACFDNPDDPMCDGI